MKFTFIPEYRFNKYSDASAEFLLKEGFRGIILDIDNTLEPYETAVPGEKLIEWFDSLRENGIKVAFVSNNNRKRVELFNKELKFPCYSKGKKPFKRNVLRAMADMGTTRENTVLMGDQMFTDVWAAHNAKIPAILVPPIKDKTDVFTKLKRVIERWVLNRSEKRKK